MRVIGITGGVGSGKSAVLNYIGLHYDARVIKADEVGHLLMRPGEKCFQPIVNLFGEKIVTATGNLDRMTIAELVFHDRPLLDALDAIIHPAVKEYIKQEIIKGKKEETDFFFIEAALLIEDNYQEIYDELWCVYCEEEVRMQRLRQDRGYTEERIKSLFANQLTDAQYEEKCDFMIYNSEDEAYTQEQIDRRMKKYETM